ncbi:MAG TPA: universal stress protein [Candidatus Xenobia bacterium]|jgi:nucleotide-binding universal stress UspA family protein
MIRNILVPVDFNDLSANAVGTALDMARALRAQVHLVYVAPSEAFESPQRPPLLDDVSSYLNAVQDAYPDVVADGVVTNGGPPASVLVQQARDTRADLVVMATHGRHGLQRWTMGSVTEALMQQAPCPVLVVNARSGSPVPSHAGLKRILLPLDGSTCSQRALELAGQVARIVGAHVTLLHVIEPLPPSAGVVTPLGALGAESDADGRRYLASLHVDDVPVETHLAVGNPVEIILQASQHADLIVMATHGRSGLSRLLMGSTTAGVVRRSTVPVMVLTRSSLAAPESKAQPTPRMTRVMKEVGPC